MSHTIDVLEEHIKELEAQIKALTRQVDVLLVKTEKLEAIQKIINDHPFNDWASSLINRIQKVLDE